MIFSSRFPDVRVPESNLPDFVLQTSRERPFRPAVIDAQRESVISYGDLSAKIDSLAASLRHRALSKGDVVAVLAPNIPEYPVVFHAVLRAGGVLSTLNPVYTAEEIAFQLKDCGARFLFTTAPLAGKAREAGMYSRLEEIFVVGEATWTVMTGSTNVVEDFVGGSPASDDLAVLPYSSGTTGFPKGVMLTHRNLVANILQTGAVQGIGARDIVIAVLPFFHIYGMNVIMNQSLWRGATIIAMERFALDAMLAAIQRYRVTRLYVAPPIILGMAKHPMLERYDLSSLKSVLSGAAPLDAETMRLCSQRIKLAVVQGYGLTETSPTTHMTPDGAREVAPGSIGYALPGTECKVMDPASGTELGLEEQGELCIRGPQVMRGYLNNPEATAGVLDAEGFLHTGDIVRVDSAGQYFVLDRLKDLIKYKGYQVAPAELEAVLLSHEAVSDAAVVGRPDAEAGEVPCGFVVLKKLVDTSEIMAFVSRRVAPYKRLASVQVIDSIPKSASGKILRRLLKARIS